MGRDIHLLFSGQGQAFFPLVSVLFLSQEQLLAHNIRYQYADDPVWQRGFLYDLRYLLHAGHEGDLTALAARLAALAGEAAPGETLVWYLPELKPAAIAPLARAMEACAPLRGSRIHAHLVAEAQDAVFAHLTRKGWKRVPWRELANHVLAPDSVYRHAAAHAALCAAFGPEAVDVTPLAPLSSPAARQEDIRRFLASALNIPAQSLASPVPFRVPLSIPGLDVFRAIHEFPFTMAGRPVFDRFAVTEALCQVEDNADYPEAKAFSAEEIPDFQEEFAADSAALARRLGRESLFGGAENAFLRRPKSTGMLTAEQCRGFVAAMVPEFRHALLRHFRDRRDALLPEQTLLAQTLAAEQQRARPGSGFRFPRTQATLSVLTMTRNHRNYITDCMESVSAQRTDFPVEHIIVDDASDDGTQDIVDNYAAAHPHVRPIYLSSRSLGGVNVRRLFNACKTPYAALCDGDDYFTEPTKLQRQVDFLTRNPDCALCFHPVLAVFEGNTHPSFIYPAPQMMPRGLRDKYYLADLLKGNLIQTNSVVYRWRFRDGLPDWFRADLCPSDWYWHLLHAETGKLGFIPEIMAVYRRHAASHYSSSFIDHVEHRRQHGMDELETYTAMNAHFHNRYFRSFAAMANGVFTDFLDIQTRLGDSSLLDAASARYPDFALHFLKGLKVLRRHARRKAGA